jgi:hypothetical protein
MWLSCAFDIANVNVQVKGDDSEELLNEVIW